MATISLCMIVKNEEDVLERCLKSVAGLVDEIIIVDTGSTDRTREIATHLPIKSLTFPGRMTFPPPGTKPFPCVYGLLHVAGCRRRILEEDQKAFLNLKETLDPTVSVVMAPYTPA